jgi:hypothetical protein
MKIKKLHNSICGWRHWRFGSLSALSRMHRKSPDQSRLHIPCFHCTVTSYDGRLLTVAPSPLIGISHSFFASQALPPRHTVGDTRTNTACIVFTISLRSVSSYSHAVVAVDYFFAFHILIKVVFRRTEQLAPII